jgi:hypothetical protein
MIYICKHTDFNYDLPVPHEIINNRDYNLSDNWRHLRGIRQIYDRQDLPEEIGIFQDRRRLNDLTIPEGYEIVVPNNFCPCQIRYQYMKCHNIEDLNVAEEIINEKDFTDYINIQNNQECYWDNMFIMNKLDFNNYCKFLFDVLDKKTELVGDRDNCFLAERLGSYWIWKNIPKDKILVSKRIEYAR